MPQAGLAFWRLVLYCLHQAMQLAGTPAYLDLAVVDDGDPRRVVAAILEPPQPLKNDRDGLLIADITNNSAHEIASENPWVRIASSVQAWGKDSLIGVSPRNRLARVERLPPALVRIRPQLRCGSQTGLPPTPARCKRCVPRVAFHYLWASPPRHERLL